jgi:hypothetical protein
VGRKCTKTGVESDEKRKEDARRYESGEKEDYKADRGINDKRSNASPGRKARIEDERVTNRMRERK